MVRKITILGSTGSIGKQALQVIDQFPGRFKIVALSAKENIAELEEQARKYHPEAVALENKEKAEELSRQLRGTGIQVLSEAAGIERLASWPGSDLVLVALVGFSGLLPTLAAIESGKNIALANKEALVVGGELVLSAAANKNCSIIPVDSEHSAVFQCLHAGAKQEVKRIVLTASGGPFRGWTRDEMSGVTPEQALKHPSWDMGAKITVDSATLMNKGFEVIEAHWLFGLSYDSIGVVVHPESIVHSMVEYIDGSVMAQMGLPSMMHPIQYAFSFPHRWESTYQPLDLAGIQSLNFSNPDTDVFPCLKLAYDAGKTGGTMPTVLNAANEVAVYHFLNKQLHFADIPVLLERVMKLHQLTAFPTLEDILSADRWARKEAELLLKRNFAG